MNLSTVKELEPFTLKQLSKQPPQILTAYLHIYQYLNPLETKNAVVSLKYKEVEFIKAFLSSKNDEDIIEIYCIVQGVKKKKIGKTSAIEFFSVLKSIRNQLEALYENENELLRTDVKNKKWDAVKGSERMQKHGINNTLEYLSKGDILRHDPILELPYLKVLNVLTMKKDLQELQYEMSLLK